MKYYFFVLILGYTSLASAQIGYFNSNELIASLPETKNADRQLQALQDSLANVFDKEKNQLETEFNKYQTDYNNGLMSALEIQEITGKLQQKEEALKKKQSQFQFTLIQRREKLYQPTFDKVDQAIQTLGQQGAFKLIFDTSKQGGYIFFDESMDVTDELRKALGL